MIHIRWVLIFLTLFVQGCTEKFVVAEKVCIGMGKSKLAFVDFKGQEIAQITARFIRHRQFSSPVSHRRFQWN